MPDRPDLRDQSSGSLADSPSLPDELRLLAEEARTYAEKELSLQKDRVFFAGRSARAIGALVLSALALLFFAVMALIVGALAALAPVLSAWGATAAVGGAIAIVAAICMLIAIARWNSVKRHMKQGDMARDKAKAALDAQLSHIRSEMTVRNIGERVADKVTHDAREIYDQTLDVANESKGIIAGTVAALALWLLRHPILAMIDRRLGQKDHAEAD